MLEEVIPELLPLVPEEEEVGAATVAFPLEIKTPKEPEEASVLLETAVEEVAPPPAPPPPPPPPQEVNPKRKIAPNKYLAADPAGLFTEDSFLVALTTESDHTPGKQLHFESGEDSQAPSRLKMVPNFFR